MSETNDLKAAAFRLGNTQDFCQVLLDDVEFVFRERYGPKWTIELQDVFQKLRDTCLTAAAHADRDFDRTRELLLRQPVILGSSIRR